MKMRGGCRAPQGVACRPHRGSAEGHQGSVKATLNVSSQGLEKTPLLANEDGVRSRQKPIRVLPLSSFSSTSFPTPLSCVNG